MADEKKKGTGLVPKEDGNVTVKQGGKPTNKLPNTFNVQQRLAALKQLGALSTKYEKVLEKENQMKTFLAEADGTQEYVVFGSDSNEEKIRVTNTVLIGKLAQLFLDEIQAYKANVESDILQFSFNQL